LGHDTATYTQIIQKLPVNGGAFMGGPAYWNSAAAGPLVYNWAEVDVLKAYHFNGTNLDTVTYAAGSVLSPGHPGGVLTVSANGNTSGTGIVWASIPTSQSADVGFIAGTLRAYNAETLQEIWNTDQNPTRDLLGTYMKFVPPVVANGRVYMLTYDNAVVVYGLLSTTPVLSVSPPSLSFSATTGGSNPQSQTINVTNSGLGTLNFTAASDSPAWLNVSPTSGTAPQPLQVSVSVGGLGAGTYTGHITVTAPGVQGSPAVVTVTLTVGAVSPALAVDVTLFKDNGTASSSITTSSFSTKAGNELLLAFVATDYQSGANTTVTGVSGAGLTWVLVVRRNAQSGTSEIRRAFAPLPLTNVSVTATLSQSVASSMTVMSFTGVATSGTSGSGAIGAIGSNSASSGAPTASLVTTRNNSWVFGEDAR
jgi:hypothetical protein